MGNDFYNPTGYENEGLPSGRNLEGQSTLGHPVCRSLFDILFNFAFNPALNLVVFSLDGHLACECFFVLCLFRLVLAFSLSVMFPTRYMTSFYHKGL